MKKKKTQALSVDDQPIYRYWQALGMAFYSNRLYIDVVKRWRGFGFLYLLLLVGLLSIPLSARIIMGFSHYFDEQMILPVQSLPKLYIQKGEILFDKPMPYAIRSTKGEVVGLIDTTGQVANLDNQNSSVTLLITKDKIFFRPPKFDLFGRTMEPSRGEAIHEEPIALMGNEVFDGKAWVKESGVVNLKYMTALLMYPAIVFFFFGFYLVGLPVFAFLGQFFSQAIFKYQLTFKASCRLMSVAATAQTALLFTLLTMDVTVHGLGLSYVILLAAYYSYGIICVRRDSQQIARL